MTIERDEAGRVRIRPRPGRPTAEVKIEPTDKGSDDPLHDAPPSKAPVAVSVREDSRGVLQDWMCGKKLRGERAGELCRTAKMRGAKTCRMHGSASRMAREAAHERILKSADHAAKKLIEFMNAPDAPYNVKLAAARDLLDRADLSGTSKVDVGMTGFEEALGMVVGIQRYTDDDEGNKPEKGVTVTSSGFHVSSGRGERWADDIVDAEVEDDDESDTEATIDLPLFAPPSARPREYRPPAPTEERVNVDPPIPESVRRRMPGGVSPGGKRRTPSTMG